MSEHTPGPWLRDGLTVYALEELRTSHGSPYKRNRFCFWVQGPGPDAELQAVARLAQAAPDLLEALRLWHARAMGEIPDGRDVKAMTEAAIAKAEGQETTDD